MCVCVFVCVYAHLCVPVPVMEAGLCWVGLVFSFTLSTWVVSELKVGSDRLHLIGY